jgi:hypothetical protein
MGMEDNVALAGDYAGPAVGDRIAGVLSCYDRIVITGTVPVICYAGKVVRLADEESRKD